MSNSGGGGLSPIGGLRPIGNQGSGDGGQTPPPASPPSTPAAGGGSGLGGIGGGGLPGLAPVVSPGSAPPPAPPAAAPGNGAAPASRGLGGLGGIGPGGGAAPAPPASSAPAVAPAAAPPSMFTPPPSPAPAGGGGAAAPMARPAASAPAAGRAATYEDPEMPIIRILLMTLGSIAAVALIVGGYFLLRPSPPAVVPTSFSDWTSADGSISCQAPDGWSVLESGKTSQDKQMGLNGVTFTSGGAGIQINISNVADLVQSQLLLEGNPTPEAMQGSKANGIMRMNLKPVQGRFKGYKETDLTPMARAFAVAMGGSVLQGDKEVPDIALTEWTADGNRFGFGGKMHGFRAAMGGGKIIASCLCYCSEKQWPQLKGPFLHVMTSVRDNNLQKELEEMKKKGGLLNVPGAGGVNMPSGM